ncbi:MAG: YoaK family protein [Pontiella sp.]
MISKLPRWVEYGSFVLALIAGFINAIGLLGFNHQAVSHLSGTATIIGTGLIQADFAKVSHLLMVLFSFLVGAALSGFFLRSGALKLGRNYSRLLCLQAALLLGAIYFFSKNVSYGLYLATSACGLQNALVTTYSGAIIRTTHITGIVTDLGIMIGARFRGEPFDQRKALLFLLIISGFILGGSLGAYFYRFLEFKALFVPVILCLLLALLYSIYTEKIILSRIFGARKG